MSPSKKGKKLKETLVVSELPEDLIIEILLRLPIKQIGQFKCVSKPWQSLFSSPQFVRDHLKSHIDDPEDLVLTSDQAPYIITLAAAESSGAARKVQFQFGENRISVGGSCGGLVLLLSRMGEEDRCEALFNPITLESTKIHHHRSSSTLPRLYGFGHDSLSDDYKIVFFGKQRGYSWCSVEVYSVKMKSWKRILNYPHDLRAVFWDKAGCTPGVFLNGCLHWLVELDSHASYVIVCFDLTSEEFKEVLVPPDDVALDSTVFDFERPIRYLTRVPDGCLALVSEMRSPETDTKVAMDVWVMKKYGVRDSWTKFTIICPYEEGYEAVCALNEDEIVIQKKSNQLIAYNWKNRAWRDLVIDGIPDGFYRIMKFRGSLLSP